MSKAAWRLLCWLGLVLHLGIAVSDSPDRVDTRVVALGIVVGLASLITLTSAFRNEFALIRRTPDLLVPIGIWFLVEDVTGLIYGAAALAWVNEGFEVNLPGIALTLSLGFVVHCALWVVCATWWTRSIVAVTRGEPLAWSPLESRQDFPRVLGAYLLGWGLLLLVALVVMSGAGYAGAMGPAIGFLFVYGVIWNLWTVSLLPMMIVHRGSWKDAVLDALSGGWPLVKRWAGHALLVMALLGAIVYLNVNNYGHHQELWRVNLTWLGGYPNQTDWYDDYVAIEGIHSVPLVQELLRVLFFTLAVALKLRITEQISLYRGIRAAR